VSEDGVTGEERTTRAGPLAGVTVLELGGIGPLPLLAMLFADMGARIVRVDPVGTATIGSTYYKVNTITVMNSVPSTCRRR